MSGGTGNDDPPKPHEGGGCAFIILAAIALIISAPAFANGRLPEPTDLKAAFCAGVLKELGRPGVLTGDEVIQKATERVQADYDSATRRLKAYLLPRSDYLDTEFLFAAMNIGEATQRQGRADMIACKSKGSLFCITDATKRSAECLYPDFLPF